MSLASVFDILPAIDLRGGRVVRLEQGDFDRETSFSDDAVAVAESFAGQGARWLHVVDLDGARTGEPVQAAVLRQIVGAVGDRLAVEVAGGLRSIGSVAAMLDAGAARAVVGTAVLREPRFATKLIEAFGPDRIAVALDVREGRAVGHGWADDSGGPVVDHALADLADAGVMTFEVTAIDRDGMLAGPDLALYGRLVAMGRGSITASAGVTSAADLAALRAVGCAGAIVGRALYDGRLDLASALDVAGAE